jgi:MYXO-CTERM domain-containing protein
VDKSSARASFLPPFVAFVEPSVDADRATLRERCIKAIGSPQRQGSVAMARFQTFALALSGLAVAGPGVAADLFIDFDVNPGGTAISAPTAFDNASPLRNTYATWGVHFSGPQAGEGGAILNASSFTSPALSGVNFLAFSAVEPGFAGPETIRFDTPMSVVSISASALSHPMTFTMQALDGSGAVVDTASLALSGAGYGALSVNSSADIRAVVLSVRGAGTNAYVFDNLFVSTVPEPPSALLAALGLGLIGWRRVMKPAP